jgi:anti-anti-sigma factor
VTVLRTSMSDGADGPVLELSGEADTTSAALLREMLTALLETGAQLVTIQAAGLSFLDSDSMRVLVLAARALHGRHGRLVLARPQPVVAKLLEITGADRLLDVQELARSVPAQEQATPGRVPTGGPHTEDATRIQLRGHVPDIGQDGCCLRRTGRPENVQ